MTVMFDLGPAARQMVTLLDRVTDDQLTAPTPCEKYTLGDLIDHVGGLAQAFTVAAAKDIGPATAQAPSGQSARLGEDWRTRIPERLLDLVEAWRRPEAWEGTTRVAGLDLPAGTVGKIALNELIIHGWDVARASGQPFDCDPRALAGSLEFLSMMATPGESAGRGGFFGPVIDVPDDAPTLERVIGLSGRDPSWQAC